MDRITRTNMFLRYHLPAILYAAAILSVSCIPNLKTPEIRFLTKDKVAHFLEYAIFAFLTFRSFAHLGGHKRTGTVALLTILLLAGFAALDELLQGLIPGRHSDILDCVADLTGGSLVVIMIWLVRRRQARTS